MNQICITGRLTRDPESRMTQSGKEVVNFCVAVNRVGKDAGADFINCVAFGKQAEVIGKYFIKGMKIDLSGRLQTGSYTDKNGNKVYTCDVVAERVEFGESRKAAAAEGVVEAPKQERTGRKMESDDSFMYVPDDGGEGLPFE